jgi:Ni/Fe-hydrogenase subunit HybB-like protein
MQRTIRYPVIDFRPTPYKAWVAFLVLILAAGAIAGLVVFTRGLVVTNLTDLVPWGLWITIDLSSIAMSAGAFMLCAAVYILGLKKYQPLARTATYIGLTGYTMAVLTLLLDIGKPERFWHALVYWNTHSLLWEITICVTLYLTVLSLEVLPTVGQASWFKSRLPGLSRRMVNLHKLAPILAIAGLCLSMLHQSSLGAAYGVLKARPVWFKPDLAILFMASAIVGGLALTILVSMLAQRLDRRVHVQNELLDRLAQFTGWALVVYLYFRFWDALSMTYTYAPGRTEGLNFLTKGPLAFNFWAGEMFLGAVIPIILLLVPKFRQNMTLRIIALLLIVGGVVAYRWDTNLAGQLVLLSYLPQDISARYTSYFPSLVEFISGAGVVAFGLLSLTLGIRYLNIVDHSNENSKH